MLPAVRAVYTNTSVVVPVRRSSGTVPASVGQMLYSMVKVYKLLSKINKS